MRHRPKSVPDLKAMLDRVIADQTLLCQIRRFNHAMVEELDKIFTLSGCALLDVGASVWGFALEAALDRGVALYEGATLGVKSWRRSVVQISGNNGQIGRLLQMNAEHLKFPAESFDCLLSVSTFEHFLRPSVVLAEMYRVLRRGGVALVSFDGVWSCSYGHHLLHYGEAINRLPPPWSHLFFSEDQMRKFLRKQQWPDGAAVQLNGAVKWIYRSKDLNRIGIRHIRNAFEDSAFKIDWIVELIDGEADELKPIADYLSRFVPYTSEELLTRGLSILLRKGA
jgi:SAM-dependent methyltransferase